MEAILTVCSCHVTCAFQNKFTLYICLKVKKLLGRKSLDIWSLSDSQCTRTDNNLVPKRTLNHLAKLGKWLSYDVSTYMYGAFDCMFLSSHICISEWIHTLYLPQCQGARCSKQVWYYKLSGCWLESSCTHLNFTYCAYFKKYSSILWPVRPNGWVFVYKLRGFAFEYSCSRLTFRYRASFEQGVPWHLGKYRVWIHSEMRTWHDKNIQSNPPYREVLTTQLNHLVSLALYLSVRFWSKWLWVQVQLQSVKL